MNTPTFHLFTVLRFDVRANMRIVYNRDFYIMFKTAGVYLITPVCKFTHYEYPGIVHRPFDAELIGREFDSSFFEVIHELRDVCRPEFPEFVEIQQGASTT